MAGDKPETLGRYKLLALLATGGMAEIHLARQTGIQGFERLAVVKKILPNLAREPRFLEMFFDEARIAAQLNHPNIVQIYELGQDGNNYFIAMEYLEGESLAYLIHEAKKNGQHLSPDLAAGIIAQVCDGLDFAHNLQDESGKPLNIVHRDVSPQNIIVLFSGSVKLVDFGIAKAASQVHQTRVGTLKGKLAYMSPEQCRGQAMDARSDVFCLGVVFWELLARQRLFKREGEVAILHAIVYEDIPTVRSVRPEVPEALDVVAQRALQKDPRARFQPAAAMAEAIREHLRQTGAAAGGREISAFVNQVFAQRARTKKKLLEDIRKSDGEKISLGVLKPDTYASLPSGSREIDDLPDAADAIESPVPIAKLEQPTNVARSIDDEIPAPVIQRRLPKWIWIAPAGLLVIGLILWLAIPGTTPPGKDGADSGGLVIPPPASDDGVLPSLSPDSGAVPGTEPVAVDAGPVAQADTRPSRLNIRTVPSGCHTEVDGVEVPGVSPVDNVELSPDTEHTVKVACTNHETETKGITLKPGENTVLTFTPAALKAPAGREYGNLKIDTDPWSDVYLGQRKLGTTPILGVRLPAGTHRLTMVNPELKIKKTITVNIDPGRTTTVFKDLSP